MSCCNMIMQSKGELQVPRGIVFHTCGNKKRSCQSKLVDLNGCTSLQVCSRCMVTEKVISSFFSFSLAFSYLVAVDTVVDVVVVVEAHACSVDALANTRFSGANGGW